MQEYNSTSKQQQERLSTAHIIISTEGSDNASLEAPNLEQAYSMMGAAASQSAPFQSCIYPSQQSAATSHVAPLSRFSALDLQ